jgi:hypothetical protein
MSNYRMALWMGRMRNMWLMRDERGGASVLLFGLLALVLSVLLFVTTIEWTLVSFNKTKTKLAIDQATHSAALNIDPVESAYGRLVWDEAAGREDFYKYISLNLRLNSFGEPAPGSHLTEKPLVHSLEFVSLPSYPGTVLRTVVVDAGEPTETVRSVDVTVFGPSVVAVLEVHQRMSGGRAEPVVLSSVASVRFR